jgi:hypothetical protein
LGWLFVIAGASLRQSPSKIGNFLCRDCQKEMQKWDVGSLRAAASWYTKVRFRQDQTFAQERASDRVWSGAVGPEFACWWKADIPLWSSSPGNRPLNECRDASVFCIAGALSFLPVRADAKSVSFASRMRESFCPLAVRECD